MVDDDDRDDDSIMMMPVIALQLHNVKSTSANNANFHASH